MRIDFDDFCQDAGGYCLHAWEADYVIVEFGYGGAVIVRRFDDGDAAEEVFVPDVDDPHFIERPTELILVPAAAS